MVTLFSDLQQISVNLILDVWLNYFITLHYEMLIIDIDNLMVYLADMQL